jgi:hypothetical protein
MSIGYCRAAGAVPFVHHKTVTKSLRTLARPRRAVVSLLAGKIRENIDFAPFKDRAGTVK